MCSNKSEMCHLEFGLEQIVSTFWITAYYIQRKEKCDDGVESCEKLTNLEWILNQKTFAKTFFYVSFSAKGRPIGIEAE